MNRFGRLSYLFSLSVSAVIGFSAHAAGPSFQNLSDDDFKKVVQDLSADFTHTSVSGASPLGDIWGFEIGLVGGMSKTPELNKFAKEVEPSADLEQVPHGEIIGVVSVPFAITGEVGFIPKVGSDEFKFSSYHLAAKWSLSELFFEWPVAVAVKAQYSKVNANFKDTINGIPTTFDYDESILGGSVLVSKNFAILEPYAGFGYLQADGHMGVKGSPTVFSGARMSASSKPTSSMFMVGTEVKLLVVKLGVEYMNAFDTSRFTGKVSFYF